MGTHGFHYITAITKPQIETLLKGELIQMGFFDQELAVRWQRLDVTVEEGIDELSSLCAEEVSFNGRDKCNQIPQPRASVKKLTYAAHVQKPDVLPSKGVIVTTKKKLTSRRKSVIKLKNRGYSVNSCLILRNEGNFGMPDS